MSVTRSLAGKVALVTGGSRGIGRAVVAALAVRGAAVAVNYMSDHESAESAVAEARAQGVEAHAIQAHVGDDASRADLWKKFDERFGRLDFLVVNAATGVHRPAIDLSLKGIRKVFAVNFESLLFLAQEGLKRMPPAAPAAPAGSAGRIVALSSIGAERVLKDYASVGTSKAALEAMCRQLACELGPRGVNVNVVRCGLCDTGILNYVPERARIIAETLARTPAGRLVLPEDVAELVLFALAPEARMITGQILNVDGGYSATCS